MITAGIDSGAKNVKVVIMEDGRLIGKAIVASGIDMKAAINQAYEYAIAVAEIQRSDVRRVVSTGAGRKECDFANDQVTEVSADVKGIRYLMPGVRTIIDVGAEESRAIKISEKGTVLDFAINDKCAAGTGSFVEATARALETHIEDMAKLYDQSTKDINMNAQCAIFAESEVVSLIHTQTAVSDIVRAVLNAIGDRAVSMIRRVGIEEDIAAIGGMALNGGFIKAIEQALKVKLIIPKDPQYVTAIGAALIAAEQVMEELNHGS